MPSNKFVVVAQSEGKLIVSGELPTYEDATAVADSIIVELMKTDSYKISIHGPHMRDSSKGQVCYWSCEKKVPDELS